MSVAELHAVRRSLCCVCKRGIEAGASRNAILPRAHIDLPDHAHLQVLGRRDVAVPEVGAGIRRKVVIGEAAADVDGDRGVRHAVVERRGVGIAVEVDRVLLEQVRPHDHAHVGEREEELVVLVDRHQRRRDVAVHHADVHDLARIHVPIDRGARGACSVVGIHVGDQPHRAVIGERARTGVVNRRGRIAGHQRRRARIHAIEDAREFSTGQAGGDIRQAGQRPEGEHVRLRAVAHRRVTVAARDLLALDGAVHVRRRDKKWSYARGRTYRTAPWDRIAWFTGRR